MTSINKFVLPFSISPIYDRLWTFHETRDVKSIFMYNTTESMQINILKKTRTPPQKISLRGRSWDPEVRYIGVL